MPMCPVIIGLIRRMFFWLLYFALIRTVFLGFYANLIILDSIPLGELLATYYHALKLDISTASYLLTISYILLLANRLSEKKIFLQMDRWLAFLVMMVYALIASGELGLYGEWNTKLSYKALTYLERPDEVFNSISTLQFAGLIVLWLVQLIPAFWLYRRWMPNKNDSVTKSGLKVLWTLAFIPFLLFTAIRGGWGAIPITTSSANFSSFNILNVAAVNDANNLMVSMLNSYGLQDHNPFLEYEDAKARQIVHEIHTDYGDSTQNLFNIHKPNIVILLMESWSADLIQSLGGEPGITPEFRKLEKDGLLFTQFYASGNRSQQAIASLFGGLPAIPVTTLTLHPEKYAALPGFINDITRAGYHTSFWFGGDLNYGNILSYLLFSQFKEIVSEKDLPSDLERGKLGVHDGPFLSWTARNLIKQQEPFFATMFTLSSHSPYDYPMEETIKWPKTEKEFVNSAHYSDRALGQFFDVARVQPWYNNTIFLIMADHSHHTYRNHPLASFGHHKIPLLIYGPALDSLWRGKQIDLLADNTDISATLLAQLGLDHSAYVWSKDIMNVYYRPMAFFELGEQGFGYGDAKGRVVYDRNRDVLLQQTGDAKHSDTLVAQGKAYLQVLFEDFLGY